MVKHTVFAMVVVFACVGLGCNSDTEAPNASEETSVVDVESETGQASSALLDPKCVEECEEAYEASNQRCRTIGNATLRQACWIASNTALAVCMKLCPEIPPCCPRD